MGWPYDKYLWREDALPAKRQYAAVAKTISQFEPVTMWTDPSVVEDAKQYLADAPNVTVKAMPINDGKSLTAKHLHQIAHLHTDLGVPLWPGLVRLTSSCPDSSTLSSHPLAALLASCVFLMQPHMQVSAVGQVELKLREVAGKHSVAGGRCA